MDARFVVKHSPCREDMAAFARALGKRSRILLSIIALVWWVYFALEVYWYYWDVYHTLLLIFAAALTLLVIFFPRVVGWNAWRSRNRKITESTQAFLDDCMRISTNLNENTIQYDVFMRIVESDGYFYLFIQKRLFHIVAKADFVQGDAAEFGPFIEEKTGLKIKRVRG